jgi:hypothetical protein
VDPELPERVDALLAAAAIASLSLARKAGGIVTGFAKVEAAVAREPVVALIHAAEAGGDGVAKLDAAARRRFGQGGVTTIRIFGAEQLDLAFGRTNVIHAAVLAGPAGENLLARVGALFRYRGGNSSRAGDGDRNFDASTELNAPSLGTVGTL